MGESLVEDLKGQAEACLTEIKLKVQKRIRDEVSDLEKKATRECTSVEQVVKVFQSAEAGVEGDATRAIWFSEAFDGFARAITAVTFRVEKKNNELHLELEKTKLEVAKAETKYTAEIATLQRSLEDSERTHTSLEERAESAENALIDVKRQFEELEMHSMTEREEMHTRMAELQHQLETIDAEAEQRGKASVEDNSDQIADLMMKLTQKDVIVAQLSDESQDVQSKLSAAEQEVRDLRESLQEIPSLKSRLEDAELKAQQYEVLATAAKEEVESLRVRHEEEATSIQAEAMETVTAIKSIMNAEREKFKKAKAKHGAALTSLEEQMAAKDEAHNATLKDAEERLARRDVEMGEVKRLSKQKEEGLRAEIDRYSTLFKEQQGGLERHRKEFADQLREARASALLIANEHKESAREAEKKRRDLETEMATLRARFDASERRKASLEEELRRAREMLSKNKNSSVEMTRLSQELSIMTQQKDAAEASLKAARIATDAALKSETEVRRKCDSEITKMKMRYERQLSVLESRLLE